MALSSVEPPDNREPIYIPTSTYPHHAMIYANSVYTNTWGTNRISKRVLRFSISISHQDHTNSNSLGSTFFLLKIKTKTCEHVLLCGRWILSNPFTFLNPWYIYDFIDPLEISKICKIGPCASSPVPEGGPKNSPWRGHYIEENKFIGRAT